MQNQLNYFIGIKYKVGFVCYYWAHSEIYGKYYAP